MRGRWEFETYALPRISLAPQAFVIHPLQFKS